MYSCARKLLRYSIAPLFLLIFYVQPVRAALAAVPNSIDFGAQPLDGTPQSTVVTLNNNTARTFSIVSISDSTPEFSLSTPDLPVTVPPGGSLTVNVTFKPDAAANFAGSLGFTTSHGWTVNVPISGSGIASQSANKRGQLSYFGVVNFSGGETTGGFVKTLSLSNSSSVPVTISNIFFAGPPLDLSGLDNGTVLSPGQSISVTAFYASGSANHGTIFILSDAVDSPAVISWVTPSFQGSDPPSSDSSFSSSSGSASASSSIVSANSSSSTPGSAIINSSSIGPSSTSHSVDLTWSPSSSDAVLGYKVYRSSVSGGPYDPITTGPVASTDYLDTSATSSQTFYYVVTALAVSGQESGFSGEVAVAVP